KPLPLHLEIQRHRGNPVGLIRSSFRENGKVRHSTYGRITGLSLEQLKLLQAAFRGDVVPKGSAEDFQILASKEYGASYALLELAKELGLDRALYSRKEAWVQDCLAMIVGRLVYAGSKLSLSNQWKNTALWELSGVEGKVDVDLHCYLPMDRLLERHSAHLGRSSFKGWSLGALRHYQQLLWRSLHPERHRYLRLQSGCQARSRTDGDC